MTLDALNTLPPGPAQQRLLACCSSRRWAAEIAAGRPYASAGELLQRSDETVAALAQQDLADALAGHPRIGEHAAGPSAREQAGVPAAGGRTARALADGNAAYEQRFGHIYLVCATGRSGGELLALLTERLRNDPATEWDVVRRELGKINRIRLLAMLDDAP